MYSCLFELVNVIGVVGELQINIHYLDENAIFWKKPDGVENPKNRGDGEFPG